MDWYLSGPTRISIRMTSDVITKYGAYTTHTVRYDNDTCRTLMQCDVTDKQRNGIRTHMQAM